MSVLVVGSVALDSVQTPSGSIQEGLGGAATYASCAASIFTDVNLVGIVGTDFPDEYRRLLESRRIDLTGLEVAAGRTFRWSGAYMTDLNQAETLDTELNVFEDFDPTLPKSYRDSEVVFLANINPSLQLKVLDQASGPRLTIADTMNLWISLNPEDLRRVIERVDVMVMNDAEAISYTQTDNVIQAGQALREMGPATVIVKKGEHGVVLFHDDGLCAIPAYPLAEVVDPTGAGDTFAGGFVGYLDEQADFSMDTMRRAIAHGSVLASFNVQSFSLESLSGLSREDVDRRYSEFVELARIE